MLVCHIVYACNDVFNFRTCLELAEVCREVGLPPGVLNILTGLGPEAGAPLASHPNVGKIQLTFNHLFHLICLNLNFDIHSVIWEIVKLLA